MSKKKTKKTKKSYGERLEIGEVILVASDSPFKVEVLYAASVIDRWNKKKVRELMTFLEEIV